MSDQGLPESALAIVGLAGRFPGARDVEEFWRNLRDGVESISFFTDEELLPLGFPRELLSDPRCVKARAALTGVEDFDPAFFGYTPREAEIMDPQHRLFLECSWEAVEGAGYDPAVFPGRVGVFAGATMSSYLLTHLSSAFGLMQLAGDYQVRIGNRVDNLTTRVSYKLNLKGPSVTVQTACSTSLVAVHMACQSLLNGECEMALAGGSSVFVPQKAAHLHQEGGIASSDGHCRAFSAEADGTVGGNGVGVVVIRRLADAIADGDAIHAVILGSAINNDGMAKVGYTAPSVEGQSEVIADALAMAGVDPATITYVEAHGTGTPVGDPIEVTALAEAHAAAGAGAGAARCAIGSVKSNIGHLDVAAGIAGLIKTVQALRYSELPPSLHYGAPNPKIGFESTRFYVNASRAPWPRNGAPRRAGVSSFGIGGTNAHVVLEEAPQRRSSPAARSAEILLLSARTPAALETATANLGRHLAEHPDLPLADVAHTLQVGRRRFGHRRMVVCHNTSDAAAILASGNAERMPTAAEERTGRPVAFLFPGQGAQHAGMARGLHETEPVFRDALDRCADLLKPHLGLDLREVLFSGEELTDTALAQPALFAVEHSLALLWASWGLRPQAMLGHSVGEYVAACLAGVFSLEDALALVAERGRLIGSLPAGAMLAVSLSEEELAGRLTGGLSLAAVNAPRRAVVSGPEEEIAELERALAAEGSEHRRLHTSHAFHSAMMEPILTAFEAKVRAVRRHPPRVPVLSNLTGTWLTPEQAADPAYWSAHLRNAVRFADGVSELLTQPDRLFLEVGPGRTLTTLVSQNRAGVTAVASLRHPREETHDATALLGAVGRLWMAGADVQWSGFRSGETRLRVPLPTYPFERRRCWIEAAPLDGRLAQPRAVEPAAEEIPTAVTAVAAGPEAALDAVKNVLKAVCGLEPGAVDPSATFLDMGFDSLLFMQITRNLEDRYGVQIAFGQLFEELGTPARLARHLLEKAPDRLSGATPATPVVAPLKITEDKEEKAESPAAPAHHGPWKPLEAGATVGLDERQQRHLDGIIASHTARTAESKRLTAQYRSKLADNRASAGFRVLWKELVYPIVADRSAGSRIWDVDGNEYVDLVMGFGVNLFGHNPEFVTEALSSQLARGLHIGPQSHLAGRVAEGICDLTGAERVAFCNTGSEAVMAALRLARTVTGRSKIVIFAGSYHGISDGVLARPRSADGGRTSLPVAPGIPPGMVDEVLVLEYGSPASLAAIEAHAGDLAAVLVEPVQSSRPDLQPREFLHSLRGLTERSGIAMIFDETILGFRVHPGGAQAWFGVQADIATYGKVIGGGMPIGVIAGKAAFLDAVDGGTWSYGDDSYPRANQTFFAGTFSKHPLTMAAAAAVLDHLKAGGPALQRNLNERTERFCAELNGLFDERGLPMRANRFSSFFRLAFDPSVRTGNLLYYHLMARGFHIWEGRTFFLSTAHTDAELEGLLGAFREGTEELAQAGFLPVGAPRLRAAEAPAAAEVKTLLTTEAQKGLWVITQLGEEAASAYNESLVLRLRGDFDAGAMRGAALRVVARHESLRSVFSPDGETVRVLPEIDLEIPLLEFSLGVPEDRQRRVDRWLEEQAEMPFDLVTGPLLRIGLARLGPDEHLLSLTIHHAVSDAWSIGVVQREIGALYHAGRNGLPLELPEPMQLSEYVALRARDDQGEEMAAAEAYWLEEYRRAPAVLSLPTDGPRPAVQTYNGTRLRLPLPADLRGEVARLGSGAGATVFMGLLAGFDAMACYLSGETDLVVAIHSAGQQSLGGKDLVGFCINMLPIRVAADPGLRFVDFLRQVKEKVLAAQRHQRYPFSRLVKALELKRDPARPPLATMVFNVDRVTGPLRPQLGGLEVERINPPRIFSRFDLLWNVGDGLTEMVLDCTYNRDLFEAATIRRWAGLYEEVLRLAAASPESTLGELMTVLAEREAGRRRQDEERLKDESLRRFSGVKRRGARGAAVS